MSHRVEYCQKKFSRDCFSFQMIETATCGVRGNSDAVLCLCARACVREGEVVELQAACHAAGVDLSAPECGSGMTALHLACFFGGAAKALPVLSSWHLGFRV